MINSIVVIDHSFNQCKTESKRNSKNKTIVTKSLTNQKADTADSSTFLKEIREVKWLITIIQFLNWISGRQIKPINT